MTKSTHDYAAVVQQHKQLKARSHITAAQVVCDNQAHWIGYAEAGATFALAVEKITAPYVDEGVKRATVAREFNRIYGSWKNFRRGPRSASSASVPTNPAPLSPSVAVTMPVLNDDRVTGGFQFGGQA